ncbi:MAG TPA: hypothetical protein VGF07_09660 [Stellaceae bacterium]
MQRREHRRIWTDLRPDLDDRVGRRPEPPGADLWRQGDHSLEWLLKEAMAGEIFNAGHSERGNDLPVLLSTSKAERVAGGSALPGTRCSAA